MCGTRARVVDLLVGQSAHVLQAALTALAVQRVEDELYPPRLDCCQAARADRFLDDLGRREAYLVRVRVRVRVQLRVRVRARPRVRERAREG